MVMRRSKRSLSARVLRVLPKWIIEAVIYLKTSLRRAMRYKERNPGYHFGDHEGMS